MGGIAGRHMGRWGHSDFTPSLGALQAEQGALDLGVPPSFSLGASQFPAENEISKAATAHPPPLRKTSSEGRHVMSLPLRAARAVCYGTEAEILAMLSWA